MTTCCLGASKFTFCVLISKTFLFRSSLAPAIVITKPPIEEEKKRARDLAALKSEQDRERLEERMANAKPGRKKRDSLGKL